MTKEDLYANKLKTLKVMLRQATGAAPLPAEKISSILGIKNEDVKAMTEDLITDGVPVKAEACGYWI